MSDTWDEHVSAWKWMEARHPGWQAYLHAMHAFMRRAGLTRARPGAGHLVFDDVFHVVANAPGCAMVGSHGVGWM